MSRLEEIRERCEAVSESVINGAISRAEILLASDTLPGQNSGLTWGWLLRRVPGMLKSYKKSFRRISPGCWPRYPA